MQDAGLIERRSGVGSMVVAAEQQEIFVHSLTSLTELLRYPYETYRTDLSRAAASRRRRSRRTCCSAVPARNGCGCRASGSPAARNFRSPGWTSSFIPRFQHVFDLPNPKGEPVYRQIERQLDYRISRAHVEIFAGQITAELSGPMQIEEGTPALNIIRRYSGTRRSHFSRHLYGPPGQPVRLHDGPRTQVGADLAP